MLEDSSYVRCLFIDYSRAFDTINHELFIRMLLSLAMPSKVVHWIVNFLTGRTQAVSLDGKLSNWLPITQKHCTGHWHWPYIVHNFCIRPKIMIYNEFTV
jgi:Reverse transcriptase (RNA-dependent DNA polymerase)